MHLEETIFVIACCFVIAGVCELFYQFCLRRQIVIKFPKITLNELPEHEDPLLICTCGHLRRNHHHRYIPCWSWNAVTKASCECSSQRYDNRCKLCTDCDGFYGDGWM